MRLHRSRTATARHRRRPAPDAPARAAPSAVLRRLQVFFCKYNDPIYVKLEKLDIMVALASERNVDQVLLELREYAAEVDVDFVRKVGGPPPPPPAPARARSAVSERERGGCGDHGGLNALTAPGHAGWRAGGAGPQCAAPSITQVDCSNGPALWQVPPATICGSWGFVFVMIGVFTCAPGGCRWRDRAVRGDAGALRQHAVRTHRGCLSPKVLGFTWCV